MKSVQFINNGNKSMLAADNPISTTGKRQSKSNGKNGAIYSGNLNLMDDKIAQKRAQARKQAVKLVTDQFARDSKISDDIKNRYERIRALQKEMGAVSDEINDISAAQEKLKETYGITENSREQKDLELLQKSKNGEALNEEEAERLKDIRLLEKNRRGEPLTPDERERMKNIEPLTEYQRRMLDYEDEKKMLGLKKEELTKGIMNESNAIRSIKDSLLKVSEYKGMGGALDKADDIMEAAAQEIIGMLVEEGKEAVDEKLEEAVREAEKEAEEKKEQEEKLEQIKEEKEQYAPEGVSKDTQETVGKLPELESEQSKIETELKKILDEQALLEEDMKGIVVNEAR